MAATTLKPTAAANAHSVRQRSHDGADTQHLHARADPTLACEERARGSDEEQKDAADEERDDQRADPRKRRPDEETSQEITEDRDGAADQGGNPGDEALARRVLELRCVQPQLLASLRLEPYLLVLGDSIDDRPGLVRREPF